MTALTVLVADDHAPVRAGVRRALERHGITVCGEAADARSALQLALQLRPDVCLLDIRMPGGGINAARAIADSLPGTAVVMLTISQDDEDLFGALSAGASGYLLKDIDPDRLPDALEGVLRGEAALPRVLVARLVEAYHPHGRRHGLRSPHPVRQCVRAAGTLPARVARFRPRGPPRPREAPQFAHPSHAPVPWLQQRRRPFAG